MSLIFSPYGAVLYDSENKRLHEFIYTLNSYGCILWARIYSRGRVVLKSANLFAPTYKV